MGGFKVANQSQQASALVFVLCIACPFEADEGRLWPVTVLRGSRWPGQLTGIVISLTSILCPFPKQT
ncbi:hypothetical protein AVEN_136559-1, partial [Araneus ventricosus]